MEFASLIDENLLRRFIRPVSIFAFSNEAQQEEGKKNNQLIIICASVKSSVKLHALRKLELSGFITFDFE